MELSIDSTNSEKITVKLKTKNKTLIRTSKFKKGSQVLLSMISKLMSDNKYKLTDISKVHVNTGPGSFTGTRVGVAIANAIGLSLNVLVNGKKAEKIVPKYERTKFDV